MLVRVGYSILWRVWYYIQEVQKKLVCKQIQLIIGTKTVKTDKIVNRLQLFSPTFFGVKSGLRSVTTYNRFANWIYKTKIWKLIGNRNLSWWHNFVFSLINLLNEWFANTGQKVGKNATTWVSPEKWYTMVVLQTCQFSLISIFFL